jgi:hypothetical protein
MTSAIDSALNDYLHTYKNLIETDRDDPDRDDRSITLSFPFHLAAGHRIELTVTDWGRGRCLISDSARTLGEIEAAGYSVTPKMKERLEGLATPHGIRFVDTHLVLESTYGDLGQSIQIFLETSKTIGDVYLVYKRKSEDSAQELIGRVKSVFNSAKLLYRSKQKIQGKHEAHMIDLLVRPNGLPGLALNVLGGQNTHALAQVWYCKCDDIRSARANKNIKLALIYDVGHDAWSEASKGYLQEKANVVLPGNSIDELPKRLAAEGIIQTTKRRRQVRHSRF